MHLVSASISTMRRYRWAAAVLVLAMPGSLDGCTKEDFFDESEEIKGTRVAKQCTMKGDIPVLTWPQ